jgi:hypothetical protein
MMRSWLSHGGAAVRPDREDQMRRVVRCYAEGHEGQWEAYCLDFDLAVEGRSFEDVYHSLNRAVAEYLEYAQSLPAEEQARFLGRRMPLWSRLAFAARLAATTLLPRSLGGGNSELHGYTLPCGA